MRWHFASLQHVCLHKFRSESCRSHFQRHLIKSMQAKPISPRIESSSFQKKILPNMKREEANRTKIRFVVLQVWSSFRRFGVIYWHHIQGDDNSASLMSVFIDWCGPKYSRIVDLGPGQDITGKCRSHQGETLGKIHEHGYYRLIRSELPDISHVLVLTSSTCITCSMSPKQ